jgi:hypothetical protein
MIFFEYTLKFIYSDRKIKLREPKPKTAKPMKWFTGFTI